MDKYTYDDVLTEKDVRTGKVDRRIIGKLGWFSDDMSGCLCKAEEESPCRLLDIVSTSNVPFVDEWRSSYQYYMPSKQQSEEEKCDDIIGRFGCGADGKVGIVLYHDEKGYSIRLNDLTIVKVAEKDFKTIKGHLQPFDISNILVRDVLHGKWIFYKKLDEEGNIHSSEMCIDRFELVMDHLMRLQYGHVIAGDMWLTPCALLDEWHFFDSTPCGVVVEDKEE